MRSPRSKHRAPWLFGERMRLAMSSDNGGAIWVRVYGDVTAEIDFMPEKPPERLYRFVFAGRVGFAGSVKDAVRLLESRMRRTGRALPAAALVSAKEWRLTNG